MDGAVMEENRSELRRRALSRRGSLSPANCREWSRLIQLYALTLPQYLAADSVALYSAVQNEVETGLIRDHALSAGKDVYYPKLGAADESVFVRISSAADFSPGRFGLAEPTGTNCLAAAGCGRLVVFVPGVLFDPNGHRLGRGGGWYDRALLGLADRGIFIGLAYEIQIIDRMPVESWDQRVHFVITENRVIDCGRMPQ